MRRLSILSFVLLATITSPFVGCGGSSEPTAAELSDACKTQLTEDDCVTIGNNILAFTKGMENFECVWKENVCSMHAK